MVCSLFNEASLNLMHDAGARTGLPFYRSQKAARSICLTRKSANKCANHLCSEETD